ncbi:MAG: tRNA epoxyqueuosine(34) reductase QueG [Phycisphaerae bacterium]|nr:tRNA epoxyqueuosine(34) reductase QueG [Phycisphaerae bacterium]
MAIEEEIKQKAVSLGLDLVGITSAKDIDSEQIEKHENWLSAGRSGQMDYLARNVKQRFSPISILPEAKSIICVGINYKVISKPDKDALQIASYALYPDYHKFIKEKLRVLADFMKGVNQNLKFKICVDSSPLAEKALATRAGLGFVGKNRLLTNSKFGSFLLLGELITDMPLEPDKPIEQQQCGDCTKCIEVCPTNALSDNGFDARKCISYLTMKKGEIAAGLKEKMGTHLFGCEECLRACPYNEKSPVCEKQRIGFTARDIKIKPQEIIGWTEKDFETFAANSAILWFGLERIRRNALICKENQR